MFCLISFNNGTSHFPFQPCFSPFLQIPLSYSHMTNIYSGPKRDKRRETGKFKRYVDEGEGKSNRIKAGQTE